LAEHPEILEEMEAERQRMLQEKERLELELQEAQKRQAELSEKPLSTAFFTANKGKAHADIGDTEQGANETDTLQTEVSEGTPHSIGTVASDEKIDTTETATPPESLNTSESVESEERTTASVMPELEEATHDAETEVLEERFSDTEKILSREATNTTNHETSDNPQQETAIDEFKEERKVQTLMEVLDELFLSPFPEPAKDIIRKVLTQMKQDLHQVVRLIRRHADPLVGQLIKAIRMKIKDSDNPVAVSLKAIFDNDKQAASQRSKQDSNELEQASGEQTTPVVQS
jgi:hypothetical protein